MMMWGNEYIITRIFTLTLSGPGDLLVGIDMHDYASLGLIKRGWEWMRVATLALIWPPTLINSHALSACILINFELVQILMRVNERFGLFDRSWELHESRRELQKQAISKSLPIRRRRKKLHSWENDALMTPYFRGWTIKSHSPGYEIGPINCSV